MAHEVKRSKMSNDLCSSDQSNSSLSGESCALLAGFNDKKTQESVPGITPEEQVFRIDWIREEILHYVIYDNQQEISRKQIQSVRLVQKLWLSTATKLIKKSKDPSVLIELKLSLDSNNKSNKAENSKQKRKLLDRFNETFEAVNRVAESYLPFKLVVGGNFFRHENYKSLRQCFTQLGSELRELVIGYPFDGGNMPVNFPTLHFPNLRKLCFSFLNSVYDPVEQYHSNFKDNRFSVSLIQTILNAIDDLQELDIPFTTSTDDVPVTFEFLQLPPTIVSLKLGLKLESKILKDFILGNHHPNLSHLKLQLHETPFEKGLMYRILEQFRKTLVRFEVSGLRSTGRPYASTYFQFPQMEKLEILNIFSKECELDVEQLLPLQECLPNLNCIYLESQTEALLKKWIENSKFEGVNELTVSVINELVSESQADCRRSPSLEIMTQLTATFPYVKDFALVLNFDSLGILEILFVNMKQVQNISLYFHGMIQENSSDLVDSIFTGLSIRTVGALKEDNFDTLESVWVSKSGSQPSVRNLSELTTLTLWARNVLTGQDELSLVSDLLFGQVFLKMPKLRNLILHGRFQPSESMEEIWKKQGRFLKYSA